MHSPCLLPTNKRPLAPQKRMPSRMLRFKTSAFDGGWRHSLLVRGPGIRMGTVDSTLVSLHDLVPTFVDLAGGRRVQGALRWDGVSIAPLLAGGSTNAVGNRSAPYDTRFVVTIEPVCAFDPDLVPELGADRCGGA